MSEGANADRAGKDMGQVMVSVIMLTYNHERFICQAIESVLQQDTEYTFELLIGDDASTDGTGDILREYASRYPNKITAFIRRENLGGSRNLYDILRRTKGKYIANCEGDDYWSDPSKLQRQVDFLEQYPAYTGCTHACMIVDENGVPQEKQVISWVCEKQVFHLRDFKGLYLPGQADTLVHRNFMLDQRHDYSVIMNAHPMVADRTIALILVLQGPIYRDDRIMSCYRRCKDQKVSITDSIFTHEADVNRMQYRLTKTLEQYAAEEYKIPIRFTRFKIEQLTKYHIKKFLHLFVRKSEAERRIENGNQSGPQ